MFKHSLFFILSLCLFALPIQAKQLLVVTEDLPPLQVTQDNGQIGGAMVDIVTLLLEEAEIDYQLQMYPWARTYDIALKQDNTLIFSILRSESREKDFHWIGQIYTLKSYLVGLKANANIKINKLEDAKQYAVGTIRDDLAETYLKEKGFSEDKNLYVSSKYTRLWQMLYNGRTALAFTNSTVWPYEIKATGLDPEQIAIHYEIPDVSTKLYIAANKNLDEKIVTKLKHALTRIKSDGRHQAILDKWKI